MTNERIDELKSYLKSLAARKAWNDDPEFMAIEYAGGNIDDAYYGGRSDGEIAMARELLKGFWQD